jgi:hypothetical protein
MAYRWHYCRRALARIASVEIPSEPLGTLTQAPAP